MPKPMRRSAVVSKPMRRSAGYSTRLLNGISSITSSGFSACICAGSLTSQLGHHHWSCGISIAVPCSTQVEAFWSNSDQNGVVSANTIRMRSTARTPSTASSGCAPRARSSCIQAPKPTNAISENSARQNDDHETVATGIISSDTIASSDAEHRQPEARAALPALSASKRGARHAQEGIGIRTPPAAR